MGRASGTVTARKDRSSVPGGDSSVPFPGVAWPLMDGESKAVCAMEPLCLSPQVVLPPHWGPRDAVVTASAVAWYTLTARDMAWAWSSLLCALGN